MTRAMDFVGLVLAVFRHWLRGILGSCAAAWDSPAVVEACNGPQRDGLWKSTTKLLMSVFAKAMKDLGWDNSTCDAKARALLLPSLDYYGCGFVSRSDLEWLDGWDPPKWLYAKPDAEARNELKRMILDRYDDALDAWRRLIDRDGSNSVSWE
ncbi:unnamed protein product, partial [Polarella glacialis]